MRTFLIVASISILVVWASAVTYVLVAGDPSGCPGGVQPYGTKYWKTLPTSGGMIDENISDKFDHLHHELYFCMDGSVRGHVKLQLGETRANLKGR